MAASAMKMRMVCGSLNFIIRQQKLNGFSKAFYSDKSSNRIAKISSAMKLYLEKAQAYDVMMAKELSDYEIGRRHLANMMGQDPDLFRQEDIDKAIEYLLPSGLYEKRARPLFKHPEETFPKKKAAEFGIDGRPFHFLFYTWRPCYYELLHEAVNQLEILNKYEVQLLRKNQAPSKILNLEESEWVTKEVMESMILETLGDHEFQKAILTLDTIANHSCAYKAETFIMKYRKIKEVTSITMDIPSLNYDENGRGFATAKARRKTANAEVTVKDRGTGQVTINGEDISYFERFQSREQVMFPLQLVGKLGEVDFEATVSGGGNSGQAGAVRLALALALRSFLTKEEVEIMRLAGLLNFDPRTRERKKPGQEGARRKYTWLKR